MASNSLQSDAKDSKSNEETPSHDADHNKETQLGLEDSVFDKNNILSKEELEEASTIHNDEVGANFIKNAAFRQDYFKGKKGANG